MRYLTLFSLEIVHSYYADGRCPDFYVVPTPETQKILNDFRCILKPFSNGVRVLIQVNNQGTPFIPAPESLLFSFHLRLKNPDFGLFTELDEFNQLLAPLYTNSSPATSTDLALISREAWCTEQFVVQAPDLQEPFVLGGYPLEAIKVSDFTVKGLGKKSTPKSFDASTRVLRVNSADASQGTPFTITYPVAPRLEKGIFTDVEIKASATVLENASVFRIVFKPKEARWKYYLVTDKVDSKTSLPVLEDKEKNIAFSATDRTDLTLAPDPADAIALKLKEKYPNKQYFRFISSELIPCGEIARKNIQLHFNGEKVIDTLANPSVQNYSIDARNSTQEYTLYQVVKYFIH